ncbi:MAG TPA: Ig-like domain-containing protein [Gemmatimonadales bacterium]|nr:Ig-like domain-containing protein [Gemmatimonadales bacterium]
MRSRSLPAIVLLLAFAWIGCGDDVESVTVTPDQLRLVVDDTVTLAASARSGDGAIMEEVITWESENPAVATVNASGLVTGVANGVVNIVATAGGVTGTAEISVFTPAVLVLSNFDPGNAAIFDSFPANMANLTIDTLNVTAQTPGVALLRQYDVVLLYEDDLFVNAPNVGDSVAAYYQAGGNVVVGTFYWQDRSDNILLTTNGWGDLENVDPFTGPEGSEYRPDSLDAESIVAHPMTAGVTELTVDSYHGGVTAKPGTTVLARWSDTCDSCAVGVNAPLLGFRTGSNGQRFVAVSVYPGYPLYGDYDGDFYTLWGNVLRWAAAGGPGPSPAAAAPIAWRRAGTLPALTGAGGSRTRGTR